MTTQYTLSNTQQEVLKNINRIAMMLLQVAALLYLVRKVIPSDQLTIVFTATRHHSEFLHSILEVRLALSLLLLLW